MNILIVDRFDIYRFGLKSLLLNKWTNIIVQEIGNFEEMLELVGNTDFDLLILDLEIAPQQLIKEFISKAINYTKVIVLLESAQENHKMKDLFMADAVSYKSASIEYLLNTIEHLWVCTTRTKVKLDK